MDSPDNWRKRGFGNRMQEKFWFFEVFRKEMQMAAACVCFNAINRRMFFSLWFDAKNMF